MNVNIELSEIQWRGVVAAIQLQVNALSEIGQAIASECLRKKMEAGTKAAPPPPEPHPAQSPKEKP
jgi:hypothetical protein